jgi:membrane-associated protease RseP (regulator of RpoE activity)
LLVLALVATAAWAGEPHTSYLGVDVDDVSADRAQALKLKSETGVEITMVDNDAPAAKAGLKEHDVILQFNGSNVESVEELRRMIRETPPGRSAALLISRDGNQQTVNVTLAARDKVIAWPSPHVAPMPPIPPIPPIHIEIPDMSGMTGMPYSSRAGLVVESLTPQLAEYFGSKDGGGALVRSVEKGSPAEAAGFKAGDVIIRIGGQKVADRSDVRTMLRSKTGKVPVGILRDKREQTLTITLPERRQGRIDSRTIVIPGEDVEIDLQELADMMPDAVDLAVTAADVELQRHRADIKKSMAQAQREMKRELAKHKEEMKRQQKEMEKQQKEMEKQQKELERQKLDQDDDDNQD